MKKSIILIISAMLLAAALCACGDNSNNPSPLSPDSGNKVSQIIETDSTGKIIYHETEDTEKQSENDKTEEKTEKGEKNTEKAEQKTEKTTEKASEKITEKVTEKVTEKTPESQTEKKEPISAGYIEETQKGGHYSNNINAYYSGNILVCGDYAVEYFGSNKNGNSDYAAAINAFVKKYPALNVTALLTPKACAFISPEGYANTYDSQKAFIDSTYSLLDSSVKRAACAEILKEHDGEYTFYRTDHHWTSLGAYYASVSYCEANGIKAMKLSDYTITVGEGHTGSLYTFCSDPKPSCLLANPDYSVAHMPKTACTMKYYSGGAEYSGKIINTSSKTYASMFLCGDQPLTHIVTENKNGKKLLVFKESYGNAFVPYMVDYYEEIVAVDFRKDTESVKSIIEKYGVTDVLIINNVQSAVSLVKSLASKLAS